MRRQRADDDVLPAARLPAVPAAPPSSSLGVRRGMVGNRRRDSSPELRLRSGLHARGWRFPVDIRLDAAGRRPRRDIAFTRRRVAVFVDGCFWHQCPEHGSSPKTNTAYWKPKLARNVARDRLDDAALAKAGWSVV